MIGFAFTITKSKYQDFIPPNGFVPDKQTAINVAEAVLLPIYGKEALNYAKPLTAILDNNTWVIEGKKREGSYGGTVYIKIQKSDGKVLYMSIKK